ncbi:DDB1- and CUL4-associated factor 6-like [Elysia marginata]|uniref:DDB1- and CUL4-associated factor 6-like n=1 Tax=Elysia marginata TaxID=1093978 RepID=A0AAV4IRS8_9GAST|nr:DDB1- and CUL4-associated factor 6-like [Elysia marginata]
MNQVNTICWNEKGTLILSGSDDQHLAVTDPFSGKNVTKFRSGHRSNIFSAKFMPCSFDKQVVSCSGSGEIFYTDIDREDTYGTNRFDCHFGSTYKLLVVPNEAATFLSCGDDGTVRFFDLRMKTSCSKFSCEEDVMILLQNPVTSMAVDPIIPYQLAVSTSDGAVRLYDRRMFKAHDAHSMNESLIFKFSPPMATASQGGSNGGQQRSHRVTSLNYRQGSHDLLVNYSSENIYLFNTYDIRQQMCYTATQAAAQKISECKTSSTSCETAAASTTKNEFQAASTSKDLNVAVDSKTPPSDTGSDSESSSLKPIKRLRLKGDWSDTGPDARPEGEESAQNIMQRMSNLLTRMLNNDQNETGQQDRESENNDTGEESQLHSEDQAQAPLEPEEPDDVARSRPVSSEEAAAMLRSVMLRSLNSRATVNRAERDVTRSNISSESMVSRDLSPQGEESPAEPATQSDFHQRPLELHVQSSGNALTPIQTSSISIGAEESQVSAASIQSPVNDNRGSWAAIVQPPAQAVPVLNKESQSSGLSPQFAHDEDRGHCFGNILTPTRQSSMSNADGQGSDMPARSPSNASQAESEVKASLAHSQSTAVNDLKNFPPEDVHGELHGESEHESMLDEASVSSSEKTQSTVRSLTGIGENRLNYSAEHSKEVSLGTHQNMDEDSQLLKEVASEEMTLAADENGLEINESNCESNMSVPIKSAESLQITSSAFCRDEKNISILKADIDTHAFMPEASLPGVYVSHNILETNSRQESKKLTNIFETDSSFKREDSCGAATENTSYPDTPATSSSVLTSDSFSVASLWSSSPSATTAAIAEEGTNSQQTLCNVSSISSHSTPVPSPSESRSTSEQGFMGHSQGGVGSYSPRLPTLVPGRHCLDPTTEGGFSKSVSAAGKKADGASCDQDYQVNFSSVPHAPCKSCGKSQGSGGKGKGHGKSSKPGDESHEVSSPDRQFVSYNSGKMRVSSDAPPNVDEAGTSGMAAQSGARASGSNSSERRRRHGHSLPPTDKFQLYGSDVEEDDDNKDGNRRYRTGYTGSRQDNKDRLSKAAKKIQEAFRQKREAREMARMKEIKEANFYGEGYVMSGSDCGRIMFWERETGRLVMYLDADKHVVNCVQPNPYSPVLASSGIDYDVKIWSPLEQDCQFDQEKSAEIVRCNERMLEVTRDTVTVPAAFMLRILASLSQIRNGRGSARQQQQQGSEPASSNQD